MEGMSTEKKWYALYTKPRWEKKVNRLLSDRGMEAYCPLNKVRKKWSDRIKLVEEPLFKSYVFVHTGDEEQSLVREVDGVLNFVYWNGKPAVIREKEISDIRRFMSEYHDVQLEALHFQPQEKVIIRSGLLMDKEATVQRVLHQTVEVVIESLGYKLVAMINKSNLDPVS
jgi:transcription antitermination factor NusG